MCESRGRRVGGVRTALGVSRPREDEHKSLVPGNGHVCESDSRLLLNIQIEAGGTRLSVRCQAVNC